MRILVIEKTEDDLNMLRREIGEAFPGSECLGFLDPLLAVKSYSSDPPDFTVFSRSMRIIDGFTLTRMLRKIRPDFTGLMLDEEDGCRRDAENYALDYLVKPVDAEKIRHSWEKISTRTAPR